MVNLTDARCLMLLALLTAVIFTVAHDQFYRSLQGRSATEQDWQRYNIAVGTLFAFVVKAAFAAAMGLAFTQALWRIFFTTELSLHRVDSLSSLLASPLQLFKALRFPVLLLIACLAWVIPISTIFPPAALSVGLDYVSTEGLGQASLIDWKDHTLADPKLGNADSHGLWVTPLSAAVSLASYVAHFGNIAPRTGIVNSSYQQVFPAPALKCSSRQWNDSRTLVCENQAYPADARGIIYASWITPTATTPGDTSFFDLPLDQLPQMNQKGNFTTMNCDSTLNYAIQFLNGTVVLYLAVLQDHDSWNVYSCEMLNRTHTVNYSFPNGKQLIHIDNDSQNTLPISLWDGNYASTPPADTRDAHYNQAAGYYAAAVSMWLITHSVIDATYLGLARPMLLSSRLFYSIDMQYITGLLGLIESDGGLFAADNATYGPLGPMLEEMFRNLTVSLMTSSALVRKQAVNMTITSPTDIYHYNQQHLWLSYGIGLALTSLVVIYSFVLVSRRGSYSTKFSTFLRTTPMDNISTIKDSGTDPLPKKAAEIRVQLGQDQAIRLASQNPRHRFRNTRTTVSSASLDPRAQLLPAR